MKRIFDFIFSLSLIIILLPIFIVTAVLIKWQIGSPILFKQVRPGLNGEPFCLYKFRTMNNKRGLDGQLLSDEERLTPIGRVIRKLSLDELPQLWNVAKGDMSFVGPRPLLMEYLPLYNKRQAKRHEVRPGITGWAQVNGRNSISWEEKFELDVWYVENQSFSLDFKIIILTVLKVIKAEDINQNGHATVTKFVGNVLPEKGELVEENRTHW